MNNKCAVTQSLIAHERAVDNQDAADRAWKLERIDMTETLKSGGAIYLDRKPYLTINDVFQQMCDDSMIAENEDEDPLLCGIRCSHFDNTGSGALIAQAMSTAIDNLLEAHEVPLYLQWVMGRDGERAA